MTALAVEKAKAMYGISKVSLLPSVGATGLWYKEHVTKDLSTIGRAYTAEAYSVNLGMSSWEIDFFGRIRSMKDNALEEYLSTEQALLSARLVLVASVAQAYLSLAADRELLRLVSKTLEAQKSPPGS